MFGGVDLAFEEAGPPGQPTEDRPRKSKSKSKSKDRSEGTRERAEDGGSSRKKKSRESVEDEGEGVDEPHRERKHKKKDRQESGTGESKPKRKHKKKEDVDDGYAIADLTVQQIEKLGMGGDRNQQVAAVPVALMMPESSQKSQPKKSIDGVELPHKPSSRSNPKPPVDELFMAKAQPSRSPRTDVPRPKPKPESMTRDPFPSTNPKYQKPNPDVHHHPHPPQEEQHVAQAKSVDDSHYACVSCFLGCMKVVDIILSFGASANSGPPPQRDQPKKSARMPTEDSAEQQARQEAQAEAQAERDAQEQAKRDYYAANRVQPGTPEYNQLKRKERCLCLGICCLTPTIQN